jgi:spore maturation protein CgeE
MATLEKMIETELEYLKCFSDFTEDENGIRFSDESIPDMYSHNLTYLKQSISGDLYSDFFEREIWESKSKGKNFLNLQCDDTIQKVDYWIEQQNCEVTVYAYFQLQMEHLDGLVAREDCSIKKLNNEQLDQALEFDLRVNGEGMGESFIKRRFERRSQVYLTNEWIDSYLCYFDGKLVGHCDLYINNDVAKIEDLDVAPEMQYKGFGTTILKEMASIARTRGAQIIYLITDDDDTAKEMYKKCAMIKVGEKIEMLYRF